MSACEFGEDSSTYVNKTQDRELWLLAHSAPAFIYLPSRAVVLEPGHALEPSGEFRQEEL